jgi:hypothetical protein
MDDRNKESEASLSIAPAAVRLIGWFDSSTRLLLLGGMLYILGFIVSNAFYGRFQVISFEILQGRYVAAALLFLIFTSIPYLGGVVLAAEISDRFREPSEKRTRREKTIPVLVSVFTLILAAFVTIMVGNLISVRGDATTLLGFISYFLVTAFIGFLVTFAPIRTGASYLALLVLPLAHLMLPIVLSSYFGLRVYPTISPIYGGGGVWLATVHLRDDTGLPVSVRTRLDGEVPLIQKDREEVVVLLCTRVSSERIEYRPTSIALHEVAAISLLRQISLLSYPGRGSDGCT